MKTHRCLETAKLVSLAGYEEKCPVVGRPVRVTKANDVSHGEDEKFLAVKMPSKKENAHCKHTDNAHRRPRKSI